MNPRFFRMSMIIQILALVTLACGVFSGKELPASVPTELSEAQPTEPIMVDEPTESPKIDVPAAPTESPEQLPDREVQLDEEYRSLEGGFAFRPITGYEFDEIFGFVTMIAPNGDPDLGPAIIMIER